MRHPNCAQFERDLAEFRFEPSAVGMTSASIAARIAALNEPAGDDPVERQIVVEAVLYEVDEILDMVGRFVVIETHRQLAKCRQDRGLLFREEGEVAWGRLDCAAVWLPTDCVLSRPMRQRFVMSAQIDADADGAV